MRYRRFASANQEGKSSKPELLHGNECVRKQKWKGENQTCLQFHKDPRKILNTGLFFLSLSLFPSLSFFIHFFFVWRACSKLMQMRIEMAAFLEMVPKHAHSECFDLWLRNPSMPDIFELDFSPSRWLIMFFNVHSNVKVCIKALWSGCVLTGCRFIHSIGWGFNWQAGKWASLNDISWQTT